MLNFRHGRSKDRHLYGRSKTLWGLQVFDNISWSFSLFNETDYKDLMETSYSISSRQASRTQENVSSNFTIIFNETILEPSKYDSFIGILNKNIIIDTYLNETITIKPQKLDQLQLKSILNYVTNIPNRDEFGSDASRIELNLQHYMTSSKDPHPDMEPHQLKRQKKNYHKPAGGYDILTEHLQIIESQNSRDCTAGTSKSLGEGVVDNSRFQIEANVAVNRANMLTR